MGKKISVTPPTRVPRKKKKAIKDSRIIYDVKGAPKNKGLTMEGIMEIYEWYGVVLWDSSLGGTAPQILTKQHRNKQKLRLIDVA